jgi:hypothetical protein
MRTRLFLVAAAAFVLLGCQSKDWRSTDPTYVPFPVTGLVVSRDNRFIGITERPKPPSTDSLFYLLDLKTGEHTQSMKGDLFALNGNRFLYSASEDAPLALIEGLATVHTFNVGRHTGWWNLPRSGRWNPTNDIVILETAWPGDREGFNGVTLLNIGTGNTVFIRLRETTEYLSTCSKTGNVYTGSDTDGLRTDSYDEYAPDGTFLSHSPSPLAVYSANCRYVVPWIAVSNHGPDDWAVYDADSKSKLMDFPWRETMPQSHWFVGWNPTYDHLLLAGNLADTIDVVNVAERVIVKRIPDNEAPIVWAGDGRATVTVRDHHIVFEDLPAALLKN